MRVVRINAKGAERVLRGYEGMTLVVDHFTRTADNTGFVAHCRDYRYTVDSPYQIWSIGPEGYEEVHFNPSESRCPKCGADVDERFDCCEVHTATNKDK